MAIESISYWAFGLILGCAIGVGVGRPLVAEHGRKVIPGLCIGAVLLGALLGWAINAYIDYVRSSATMHF